MNEMNNGGNEFNNQNMNNGYNQDNYGYQNPNVNYQNVNNNQNAEPPKKNNALLIVALLIIIGLIGFIVYDKLVKKDSNNATTTDDNQSENVNIEELFSSTFDSNVRKITPILTEQEKETNFKNLDKSVDGYNIIFECTGYDADDGGGYCPEYNIKINSTIEYELGGRGCSHDIELYTFNNYLLVVDKYDGCLRALKIHIYDKDNQEVYVSDIGYSYVSKKDSKEEITTNPIIKDGILYYMQGAKAGTTLYLKSLNLSDGLWKEKTISSIETGSYGEAI